MSKKSLISIKRFLKEVNASKTYSRFGNFAEWDKLVD